MFKGEVLAGEQPPIVDRDLFEAVQAKLTEQNNNHKATRMKSEALLAGRIFDDRGNRMSPSHARKRGIKYRYYLSSALLQGRPNKAGSIRRVSAPELEAHVVRSLRKHLKLSAPIDDRTLINLHVTRVEIQPDQLIIQLAQVDQARDQIGAAAETLHIPWQKTSSRRRREILSTDTMPVQSVRPIRAEARAILVASIARGRRWLDELMASPTATPESIAARERCSVRKVNMSISLAFLAPALSKQQSKAGCHTGWASPACPICHAEWSQQHQVLGLASR